jgi:plasmid stabilization system protein ParE
MASVLKRESAKRDLIAQWVWYAENASIEVADRFLSATEETLKLLAAEPECGAPCFVRGPELQECGACRSATDLKSSSCFTFLERTVWIS